MAGGYQLVRNRMWSDPRYRAMSEDARHAALYVLTCPHRNTEGLFRLPLPLAAYDLQWATSRTVQAFDELTAAGWIVVDPTTDLVWIVDAVADDPPKGPKRTKGAVNKLSDTPVSVLRGRYVAHCRAVFPALADAIVADLGWPEYPPDTVSEPYRYPFDSSTSTSTSTSAPPSTPAEPLPADPADDPEVVEVADRIIGIVAVDELATRWERGVVAGGLTAGLTTDDLVALATEAAGRPGVSNARAYLAAMIRARSADQPAGAVPVATAARPPVPPVEEGEPIWWPPAEVVKPGLRRARAAIAAARTPHPDHDTEHP